jgi:hypothetical protein
MRQSLTARELGEELLIDRQKYQAHPNIGHLVCLVFDYQGYLPNLRGIEEDLDQVGAEDTVACTVKSWTVEFLTWPIRWGYLGNVTQHSGALKRTAGLRRAKELRRDSKVP